MNQRQRTKRTASGTPPVVELPALNGEITRLLIVAESEAERSRWSQRTECIGLVKPAHAASLAEAIDLGTRGAVALALVSGAHSQRGEIIGSLQRVGVMAVAITGEATLKLAMDAMREGAIDLISEQHSDQDNTQRIIAAAQKSAAQRGPRTTRRLEDVCRTLNDARNEVTEQVGSMCDDLVQAYEQITEQIDRVRVSSEFGAIVRQELDLEDLLRTVLEFLLAKVGSTNSAVYLPASSGEYSLSAYVNYDCPRESGETMMEHLADVVPPAIENQAGIVVLDTNDKLLTAFGEHGKWLEDYGGVAFACHDEEGECLAVAFLFRDAHNPFGPEALQTLSAIAPVFAEQLARIVRVHCRHLEIDDEASLETGEDESPEGPFGFDDDLGWDDGIDLAA